MTISIVILAILAVGATIFVHPWFVKGVIRKDLEGNWNKIGFSDSSGSAVGAYVFSGIEIGIMLGAGLGMLLGGHVRRDWHSMLIMLIIMLVLQAINQVALDYNPNKGKKALVCLALAVVCSIIPIQNAIVSYKPPVEAVVTEIDFSQQAHNPSDNEKLFVNTNDVISLFKASSVDGPTYTDSKFLFVVTGSANGDGVAIFNDNKLTFYPCGYKADISAYVRDRYPIAEITYVGVVLDDITPYAQYVVLKRSHIFARPELNFYSFLNLKTGEFKEYTQLPEFATR